MTHVELKLSNREINTHALVNGEPERRRQSTFEREVLSQLKKAAAASEGVKLEEHRTSSSSQDVPERLRPHYQWPTTWTEVYEVLTFTFVNIAAVTAFLRNAVGLGLDVPKLFGNASCNLKLDGEDIKVEEGEDIEELIAGYKGKEKPVAATPVANVTKPARTKVKKPKANQKAKKK